MGICLILTAIVAIAAILGCILLLLCVKFVTDRDERKTQAARNKISANEEKTESGSVTSGTNTTALITDERAALTTIVVVDENDMWFDEIKSINIFCCNCENESISEQQFFCRIK